MLNTATNKFVSDRNARLSDFVADDVPRSRPRKCGRSMWLTNRNIELGSDLIYVPRSETKRIVKVFMNNVKWKQDPIHYSIFIQYFGLDRFSFFTGLDEFDDLCVVNLDFVSTCASRRSRIPRFRLGRSFLSGSFSSLRGLARVKIEKLLNFLCRPLDFYVSPIR